MASGFYLKGAAHILGLSTKVDLVADDIKLILYASTFNSAHEFISDLTGGSIVARSGNLAGKTVTGGVFDANNITLSAVSGAAFTEVLAAKDTGVDATSPLIGHWTVASFAPNGGDINVVFHASGLFSIFV